MATTILIYGVDPLLLETRRLLLSRQAFDVVVTHDAQQFETKLRELEPSVSVYCSSLDQQELERVVPLAERLRPSMKNLVVETLSYNANSARADMRVDGLRGPQAFLAAVEDLAR